MKVIHLQSIGELLRFARQWNDLWLASDVTDPTGRAELIVLWLERFAPQRRFHALVIEESGSFLAALPLVENRVRGVFKVGTFPANGWAHGGGMLLRTSPSVDQALKLIVRTLPALPWHLLWLECVRISNPSFRRWQTCLSAEAVPCSLNPQYDIAIISTSRRSWRDYWQTLRPSLRNHLLQQARRFGDVPQSSFSRYQDEDADKLCKRLDQLFLVEDRSWKGTAGSSVIKRGMLPFYQQQAVELAKMGHLAVFSLQIGSRPIAFEYGYIAKNIYHACKSGYDPEFHLLSPGQLLRYYILRELFADPTCVAYDCIGEITPTLARWQPDHRSQTGQFLISTKGIMSRSILSFMRSCWPTLRQLAAHTSHQAAPQRG